MLTAVSNAAMRTADFRCISAGTPAVELMYRAGCAIFAAYDYTGGTTAILCGTGNNGGDGYVLALLLRVQLQQVRKLLQLLPFSFRVRRMPYPYRIRI